MLKYYITEVLNGETVRDHEEISREYYENFTSECAMRFNRNLGGFERAYRRTTEAGYNTVYKLLSYSPDRSTKCKYYFDFEYVSG